MDLRDSLNRYYYDVTVSDLRQISRTGGGELSYNSIMYLDVISYQRAQGECTVSTLANTLHIPQRDRPEGDPVGRISADDTVAPSL